MSTLKKRAIALLQSGKPAEALPVLQAALREQPTSPALWGNTGVALLALRRPGEALDCLERALALTPDNADLHFSRALALREMRRTPEALGALDRTLALDPEYRRAQFNRLALLIEEDRAAEALPQLEESLARHGRDADTLANLGLAHQRLGDRKAARACFEEALSLEPAHRFAGWNLALLDLREGDYARGFEGYDAFWPGDDRRHVAPSFAVPLWMRGQSLSGRTLLVHADEGFGDTVQHLRFVPPLATLAAQVIVQVQRSLGALCRSLPGNARIVEAGDALEAFDLHCPLASLPQRLGVDARSLASPPYLAADPARTQAWRQWLAASGPGPFVGLNWAGSPSHPDDRRRSLPLELLLPLVRRPGRRFVSLQRELREGDAARLAATPALLHAGERLGDFADTAALVSALDFVITVDTAVAHVCGALGRPVRILLAEQCDWRWTDAGRTTPWYASAILHRATREGGWREALDRLVVELT